MQRYSTLFLGTHYPEEFSYNPNQTHLKRPIKLLKTSLANSGLNASLKCVFWSLNRAVFLHNLALAPLWYRTPTFHDPIHFWWILSSSALHFIIYFCPCLNPKYLVVWKYNGLRMSFLCWLQPWVLTTTEDLKWLWMKWANSENRMFESTKPVPALKCTPRPLQWNRTILALNRITLTLVWESSLHPGRGSCAKAAINTGASP